MTTAAMKNARQHEPYIWSRQLWSDRVNSEFLDKLCATVEVDVLPFAEHIDREDIYPTESIKRLAAKGYTSLTLPEKWGGQEAGYAECAALFEEVSYASAAVGISLITIFQAQTLISRFGAQSLQTSVLPEFKEGLLTSYALTEASHGSDIRSLSTKATKCSDGWRIHGRKSFITSGSAAEAYIVLAETEVGVS